MKLSARDRWLATILPAVLLMAVYSFVVAGPADKQLKALREQASTATVDPKAMAETVATQREVEALEDEQAREAARQAGLAKNQSVLPEAFVKPDRTRTQQELSLLCEKSGVLLLSSSAEPAQKLPAHLDSAVDQLKTKHGSPLPEIWKLELAGPYRNLADLLNRLGTSSHFIVPLSVAMQPNADGSISWTVIVWI